MQLHRLVPPNMSAETAISRRLARLTLETLELAFERNDDVIQTFQVGLSRTQPQLGLVASRMQTLYARGFLKQTASLRRFRADQCAYPALVNHCGRMGSGRKIGEQQLHVTRPHVPTVDFVVRTRTSFDPAHDLQLARVVELRRRISVRIVEGQGNFGDVARRPIVGAPENHVVHLAATHLLRRGFAHYPFQGFNNIRLAAAVGADDSRNSVLDLDFNRIEERLETDEA